MSKQQDHDHANSPSTSLLAAAEQQKKKAAAVHARQGRKNKLEATLASGSVLCGFLLWTPVTFPTLAIPDQVSGLLVTFQDMECFVITD